MNDHDVTVVLERLIEPLDDEVGSWDDVLGRAAEPRPEYGDEVLDHAGPAAGRRLTLEHSLARRSRRRLLVSVTAALVVVVVTASAFGAVRDLFFGSGGGSFASPVWSPDGRKIYFLSHRWGDRGLRSTEVYVMNANGSGQRNLTREWGLDALPILSPNGKTIAFESVQEGPFLPGRGSTFDADVYAMNVGGTGRRRLARGVRRIVVGGQQTTFVNPSPAWSPEGRRIVFVSNRDGWRCPAFLFRQARCDFEIYVMKADGSDQRSLSRRLMWIDYDPVWSPDARTIAFVSAHEVPRKPPDRYEIYVANADGSGQRLLARGTDPAWSPDGQKIAFRSARDGNGEVYVVNADGSGLQRLTRNPGPDGGPVWSPGGRKIFFEGRGDVYVMNADGSGQRNLTRNPAPPRDAEDSSPALSPDGRRIVFVSQRDGSGAELYVMNADGSGLRRLTRSTG